MLYSSQHTSQCGTAAFPCIINVWPLALSSQASCLGMEADCSSAYSGCCPPGGFSSTTSSQAACGSGGLRYEKAELRPMDFCAHVDPVDLTANLPNEGYGAGDPNRGDSAATSMARCQGNGIPQSVRRQKGGLSAALKATSGAVESYNSLWGHAAEKNTGAAPLADVQPATDLVSQGMRPAAAQAHELAIAAAMERLNSDPPVRTSANIRCTAAKITAQELDDAGCADGAPGSLGEAWDSLPFFSPSLVDRLWAGRASHGSSSPHAPHLHLLHPQPASQQQQPQHKFNPKALLPGEIPQPCQCGNLQLQHLTNGSAPLSRDVDLPSVKSTPTAASADANSILTTQGPSGAAIEPFPAAAAQLSPTGANALLEPAFVGTAPSALRAPAAADFGDGVSVDQPDLAAVHMPCMALVAAAAAATAAPRALGTAAATAAASGDSSRALRAGSSSPSGSGGAANGGVKMPLSATQCLPPKPLSASTIKTAAVAPVPPVAQHDSAAMAPLFPARTSSPTETGDISNVFLDALPPPRQQPEVEGRQQQQQQHDTISAALVAMAMSAYELPRGHVHNGPRMPVDTGTSPPATKSCFVQNRQQPAPSPLRLGKLSAGLIDGYGYSSMAEGDLLAAAAPPAAVRTGGGNPWNARPHEPDSPVSQASTEWEPRVTASLTASALSLCRASEGRNLSQVNLCDTEEAAMISSDCRTQWWGRDLTGGRFNEVENTRLRGCGRDRGPGRLRHRSIISGGGRERELIEQRQIAWWRWLLPFR
ncbi:hypothetical protein Vafri_19980 [Volvox africanus]|nr:hypothetical protein Vafri_19980 [Volvox africanus]